MWLDRQRSPVLAEGDEFACSALTVSTRLGRRLASAADAEARRQPISAETAFANVLRRSGLRGLELGGPRVYTYRSLLEVIALHLGKKPRLVPMPFGLWHALASVAIQP
jgi:NADH dehydrogenase